MQDYVALITGGAQGIGKATAHLLLFKGCRVVILDHDDEALALFDTENEARSDRFLTVRCNVTSPSEIQQAFEATVHTFGRLDFVVNNAGVTMWKPLANLSLVEWNFMLATNLTSVFLMAKYAQPHFSLGRGAIVNVASTRALMSEPNTEAYAATKGGVVALTHALAMSLGPHIRVNAVSPGWIDVTAYQKKGRYEELTLSEADHAQHPVGRVGKPEDVAQMIAYLLSEEASFITGQNFVVDGGMTKKMIYQ